VYETANKVRNEYFPENLTESRKRWLKTFAGRPDSNSLALLQQLVGATPAEIEEVIGALEGFRAKVIIEDPDGDEKDNQYFIYFAAKQNEYGLVNGIDINGELPVGSDGKTGRVQDVSGLSWMAIVRLFSPVDWFGREDWFITKGIGEDPYVDIHLLDLGKGTKWTFSKLITVTWKKEGMDTTYELLGGKSADFKFLPIEELSKRDPNLYKDVISKNPDFAYSVEVYERSKRFVESSIRFADGVSLPSDVRKFFTKLLVALVKNDETTYTPLLDKNLDSRAAGKMAAVALGKGFQVVHAMHRRVRDHRVQRPPGFDDGVGVRQSEAYYIYCEYQFNAKDMHKDVALFVISQITNRTGYLVVDFHPNQADIMKKTRSPIRSYKMNVDRLESGLR
jgi:hypothetical protein